MDDVIIESSDFGDGVSSYDLASGGEVVSDDFVSSVPLEYVTEEDFNKFNNNFCTAVLFVGLCLGIIAGLLLGNTLNGIFRD